MKQITENEFELDAGFSVLRAGDGQGKWFLIDPKGRTVGDADGFDTAELAELSFAAMRKIDPNDPAVQEYMRLDRYFDAVIKPFYEEMDAAQKALAEKHGLGVHWQDPTDGVVFLTHVPEWTSVKMKHFGVMRTRRPDEKKGDLSLDKARALGYTVEGK